jgi:glycosyltransferase involved in cell wall biosynthesis
MSQIRVARIISRLNIGGPAIQAITMTRLLEPLGYETLLVRGSEAHHEGSMDRLADELGVVPVRIRAMRREVGARDLVAFVQLVRTLRRYRPDIVHTHAAKAGTLGRFAALACGRARPRVIVHTFHGHSLSGYFSSPQAAIFLRIERFLSRRTTRLVAVSEEVRDDLVRLGVAPPQQIEVIHVGFDLGRFQADAATRGARRDALRAQLGIPRDARVVTIIAR